MDTLGQFINETPLCSCSCMAPYIFVQSHPVYGGVHDRAFMVEKSRLFVWISVATS